MSNIYLLKYDSENLGDDIQTIAVMDILQDMFIQHSFVYRDLISGYFFHPLRDNYIIFNGWFTNGYGLDVYYSVTDDTKPFVNVTWPPHGHFKPVLYSFHISEWGPRENRGVHPNFLESSISFYRSAQPIGCRDNHTLNILKSLDIEAYFSGCITLSLERQKYEKVNSPKDQVLMVDVPAQFREQLIHKTIPLFDGVGFTNLTHSISPYSTDILDRFALAKRHLQAFCNARLVFTSRLHVALPCLAFGTPVVFIVNDDDIDNSRIVDYLPYLNVIKHSQVAEVNLAEYLTPKYDGTLSNSVRSNFKEIIKKII